MKKKIIFFTRYFLGKWPILYGENIFFIQKTTQNVLLIFVFWKYGGSFFLFFFLNMADWKTTAIANYLSDGRAIVVVFKVCYFQEKIGKNCLYIIKAEVVITLSVSFFMWKKPFSPPRIGRFLGKDRRKNIYIFFYVNFSKKKAIKIYIFRFSKWFHQTLNHIMKTCILKNSSETELIAISLKFVRSKSLYKIFVTQALMD